MASTTTAQDTIAITVEVSNAYANGDVFEHTITTQQPAPAPEDVDDDFQEWSDDALMPLTGEGGEYCSIDAMYEVKVIDCPARPELVGREFTWG